jgi:NADH-quinone oxidoreductase subunit L
MTQMGGLLKKMPVTALTMLVGCLAISGAGIPFFIGWMTGDGLAGLGLSGFYSKDAILEQAFAFMQVNSSVWARVFFIAAAGGAAITAFYMFRLWYMTFAGAPRDAARNEHAHESPPTMYVPLIILAVMAIAVAWEPIQGILASVVAGAIFLALRFFRPAADPSSSTAPRRLRLADVPLAISGTALIISIFWLAPPLREVVLTSLLEQSEPLSVGTGAKGVLVDLVWPSEHDSHAAAIVYPVTLIALGTAIAGFVLATLMYGLRRLDPGDARRQFQPVYRFLLNKWWFDELYDWLFVKPTLVISNLMARIDRSWIDWIVDGLASTARSFAVFWDRLADQTLVDGFVNTLARWTYAVGSYLRGLQTGQLRQYVMFIVIGAVALFFLISLWTSTLAG